MFLWKRLQMVFTIIKFEIKNTLLFSYDYFYFTSFDLLELFLLYFNFFDFILLFFCALLFRRVGNGSTSDVKVPSPLDVLLDDTIVQIATGSQHTIVLTDDGKVYTWGKNDTGALGHGDSQNDVYSLEEYPRLLEWPDTKDESGADIIDKNKELDPIVYIAAGSGRSAAISRSGKLFLWGRALGHIPALLNSTALDGLKVIKVALGGGAGKSVIAIITEDNSLWTFGDGGSKLLGIKDLPNWKHPSPLKVTAFQNKKVLDVYCGVGQHIFAKVVDE